MRSLVLGAIVALLVAGCSFDLAPRATYSITATSTAEAAEAAAVISAYRTASGLPPVAVDPRLNQAAEVQARAVAQAGTLTHGDFAGRMRRFGVDGGAAENLTAGSSTVAQAIARWKASPGHNTNLLMPGARRIGLARADANGGYGRYWALVLSQ
jgi:uncharacterized protein YkwD